MAPIVSLVAAGSVDHGYSLAGSQQQSGGRSRRRTVRWGGSQWQRRFTLDHIVAVKAQPARADNRIDNTAGAFLHS
jgi:hypothetical protein